MFLGFAAGADLLGVFECEDELHDFEGSGFAELNFLTGGDFVAIDFDGADVGE